MHFIPLGDRVQSTSLWNPADNQAGLKQNVNESEPVQSSASPINAQALLANKLKDSSCRLSSDESIALLSECIRLGERESAHAIGKELVVFIGNTQAGKSTLVNYLYGCEMEGKTAKELGVTGLAGKLVVVKPTSPLKEVMPIGHSKQSMTFMPKIATDQAGFNYCDCPGFLDNRGFEINIANAVNIRNTFIKAKGIKIIILINYHSLKTDRAKGLSDMIRICADLFGSRENLRQFKDSILLGISQVPLLPRDDEILELSALKDWIQETHLKDPFEIETLKFFSERLFIYDALDRKNLIYQGALSRQEVLEAVTKLIPIKEPLKIFKTVLTAEDEKGLRKISDVIMAKIQSAFSALALSEKKYQEAAADYDHLKKLEMVENGYVLNLILSATELIIKHFSSKISRFDLCCADGSLKHQIEAKEILNELSNGLPHFDHDIQVAVNISDHEKKFNAFIEKVDAEAAELSLRDLEKLFRDQCLIYNFADAERLLAGIREKVQEFSKKFESSGIISGIDLEELQSLFDKTKKQYDEAKMTHKAQKIEITELEGKNREQAREIEEHKRKEFELQIEKDKQAALARKAEKALSKTKKEVEEGKKREAELIRDIEQQKERARMIEAGRLRKQQNVMTVDGTLKRGNVDGVKKAIAAGAKLTTQTLTRACLTRDLRILEAVIQAGAQPDEETLTTACSTGQIVFVENVLKLGAQPSHNTLEIAEKTQNQQIIKLAQNAIIAVAMRLRKNK